MPLPAGTRLGPYEIVGLLGAGGMGQVYRATDTSLKRDVAIKVLPPAWATDADRIARLQREAQVLASLNHPNIAHVHGLEQRDGATAVVMELVDGPTLDDRIRQGAMPLDEALAVARQIADALDAAHERGIVHRDLKPANIILTGAWGPTPSRPSDGSRSPTLAAADVAGCTVKVLDFGLAKAMGPVSGPGASAGTPGNLADSPTFTSPAMTAHGVILGTAAYMAPEQAKGRVVDKRADIWAFGVVLYEMVTGRRLFEGEDLTETLANVVKAQPDLTVAPPDVRRLLERCLEKDPRKRLRDIGDAWDLVGPDRTSTPAARGRAAWPWAIAAIAVAALAGSVAWTMFGRSGPPAPTPPLYEFSVDVPLLMGPPFGTSFALSPDGRELVMSARPAGSANTDNLRLWLRSLAGGAPREVPGTEGARYPFWSPDGRSIGFFAQGKLKKIVPGGLAQTLCDAPEGRGGTWNADGVILFAPTPFGQIHRVANGGGQPVPVTGSTDDAAPVRRFPFFLPDGRHFLYADAAAGGERNGIYVGSIDGQPARRLLPDDSNAVFAPAASGPGSILFVRDGVLMAQPFDADRLEPAGDVFVVADGLSPSGNRGFYGFSAVAGGSLVYRRDAAAGRPDMAQLAWRDRAGKVLESLGRPAHIDEIALSPDDTRAALGLAETDTASDVWVLHLRRGEMSRLTNEPGRDEFPRWSPDGQRIAFAAERFGAPTLFIRNAAGGGQDVSVFSAAAATGPGRAIRYWWLRDWSRDGKFLLIESPTVGTGIDMWILRIDEAGAPPTPYLQTPFNEARGRFSPDGRWVAYQSNESGRPEVDVRPFPSADGKWVVSTGGGILPVWSRDGRELYYVVPNEQTLMAVAIASGDEFRASAPRALFKNAGLVFDVARDGRFLMASPVEPAAGSTAQASSPTLVLISDWRGKVGR